MSSVTDWETKLEEAFSLCEDNLANLPSKYKRWKTLNEYRSEWNFIENREIRERIAEQRMACDYLLSLYLWLKPGLTILDSHKHALIQILGSIYEGALVDLLNKKARTMIDDKLTNSLIAKIKINKLSFYELIDIADKGGCLIGWKQYLSEVREIRNWIHLSKSKKEGIELINKSMEELIEDLNKFRDFIEAQFSKHEGINF